MILFTDLDGTLLTDSKNCQKKTRTLSGNRSKLGMKVVISTGGPLAGATAQLLPSI